MTGNELREQVCGVLFDALPELKQAVRAYLSQSQVQEKDFKIATGIWRALSSIGDAAEKLSQSEME